MRERLSQLLRRQYWRGMLDACHVSRFCREDYICQHLPDALIGKNATR